MATEDAAELIVPAPGEGAVFVEATSDGLYAEPPSYVLAQATGTVAFVFHERCSLELSVVGADTGNPIRSLDVELLEASSRNRVSQVAALVAEMPFHYPQGFRPGSYVLSVGSKGYERWFSRELVAREPGQVLSVSAVLRRDRTRGRVRLRVRTSGEEKTAGQAIHYQVLARRAGRDDNPWSFEPNLEYEDGALIGAGVPAGGWDFLVWKRPSDVVGVALDVRVRPGEQVEGELELRPGLSLALNLRWPQESDVERVELRTKTIGRLPLITLPAPSSMGLLGRSDIKELRQQVLGPWPGTQVEIVFHHKGGVETRVVWPP